MGVRGRGGGCCKQEEREEEMHSKECERGQISGRKEGRRRGCREADEPGSV